MKPSVSVREVVSDASARSTFLRFKPVILAVGVLLVVGIWLVDRSISEQVRFYAMYLLPIGLVAWHCGRPCAVAVSLLAVGLWAFGDPELRRNWDYSFIPFWNASMRLVTFLAVSLVVGRLRAAFNHERELARIDPVTGADNARSFMEAARAEIERARRYGRPFTVAYIDLDNFKAVNDSRGHDAGDAALRETARTVAADLRASDLAARLGGDEFGVLLPETGGQAAGEVLGRLRESLLAAMRQGGWPVTFSIGAVTFVKPPPDADAMLKQADDLMYAVKQNGKDAIRHETYGG